MKAQMSQKIDQLENKLGVNNKGNTMNIGFGDNSQQPKFFI